MTKTDLVIFDCDGVLIDSEGIAAQVLVDTLAAQGIGITGGYVAEHFLGRAFPVIPRKIRTDFGIDLPPDFEATYRRHLLTAYEQDLRIMPGVRAVLDTLAVDVSLATSSSAARLKRSLELVGLDRVFAGRTTTASEVARGKPAPDLFLRAAEKHGVAPARCLVVEDSVIGIAAAQAAGMTVWRFTGGSHLAGRDPGPGPEPRPDASLAAFSDFFRLGPHLRRP